jgi:hypothetical protein
MMTQSEHRAHNAVHYPGTRQLCALCDEPTGNCEEDSIYLEICELQICSACADKHDEQQEQEEANNNAPGEGMEGGG